MRDRFTSASLLILALVGMIGAIVLTISGNAVPSEIWTLETMLVGAVAGAAIPNRKEVV